MSKVDSACVAVTEPAPLLRLDLGCGKNPRQGFEGVDSLDFGQKHKIDLRQPWPWADESVDEVHSSHFVEHLTGAERIHFFNELGRVLKKGARAFIITPDWTNDCAYGDPTHQWPPMSRWYPLYLHKDWRAGNAPHVGYTCDFDYTIGGSWDGWLETRNMEFKLFAMQRYTNSLRDLQVTLTKR